MAFKIKSFIGMFLFGIFMSVGSAYANISTVGYVHDTIFAQKGITIPIDSGINRNQPHSVKYLMRQIDAANVVNGNTTSYASTASKNLVETEKVLKDVKDLIEPRSFKITISGTNYFQIDISAAGNWKIDWGDGTFDILNQPTPYATNFMHDYDTDGDYVIKITGAATGYLNDINTSAISLGSPSAIVNLEGSLGTIFPTVAGVNPRFYKTFAYCTSLTDIPSDLFAGLNGAPVKNMFRETFLDCIGLTGAIPAGLFAGITGAPAANMFRSTFENCDALTGAIPSGLFSGIIGAPALYMFAGTFMYCYGLTGSIPSNLFSGINGTPAPYMFADTFLYCDGLTGVIPSGLFSGISGAPAPYIFAETFYGCYGLISIPSSLFSGISGAPAEYMFAFTFSNCSMLTSIPTGLFSGISGMPANNMFKNTFYNCGGLTGSIPSGLFGNLYGAPAKGMFEETFYNCANLTGAIPIGLFSGISGAPAMSMFAGTFDGCKKLSSIPSQLFYKINGNAADSMFAKTFANCNGLTGYIPNKLFGSFTGEPAENMFYSTFEACNNLTGISNGIWDLSGMNNSGGDYTCFFQTFAGCSSITTESPNVASYSLKLWEYFTNLPGGGTFDGATNMADYWDIPIGW